jgi:hypothetical protein
MVLFPVFKGAKKTFQGGGVLLERVNNQRVALLVDDVEVFVTSCERGLKFSCGCTAHLKSKAQDKLCRRVIASVVFMSRFPDKVLNCFVGMGLQLSKPFVVSVEKTTGSSALLKIKNEELKIETIPTGTKISKKNQNYLKSYYDEYDIAAILYLYEKGGNIK